MNNDYVTFLKSKITDIEIFYEQRIVLVKVTAFVLNREYVGIGVAVYNKEDLLAVKRATKILESSLVYFQEIKKIKCFVQDPNKYLQKILERAKYIIRNSRMFNQEEFERSKYIIENLKYSQEEIEKAKYIVESLKYDSDRGFNIAYGRALKSIYERLYENRSKSKISPYVRCSNCEDPVIFIKKQLTDDGMRFDILCNSCGNIEEINVVLNTVEED